MRRLPCIVIFKMGKRKRMTNVPGGNGSGERQREDDFPSCLP